MASASRAIGCPSRLANGDQSCCRGRWTTAVQQATSLPPFRVVLVYIAEAHAGDKWPINSTVYAGPGNSVATHKSVDERIATCRRMLGALELDGCGVEVYVDSMDDSFLKLFACWPTRLFGIGRDGHTIERIAMPCDATFELGPMLDWLHEAVARDK